MKKLSSTILIIIILCTSLSYAHPGRTDKYGGHTNKATGEYHYHNSDGTVTVAQKPTEVSQPSEQNETETPVVSDDTISITVDGNKKPVQQSAAEIILKEEPEDDNTPQADEIITKTDENGDTIIYVPKISPYSNIAAPLIALLIILSIIGWCAISPIICILLKKIEEKNSSWTIILHVPYLLFWLPSLPGKLLYKIYNKISPKENREIDDYYDDDYEEEI